MAGATNANTGIAPIFDAESVRKDVQAQAAITQEFGTRASQWVGEIAQQHLEDALNMRLQAQAAQSEGDSERAAQLNAQADQLLNDWGNNGTKRLAAHTVMGALTGGVDGAAGAATATLSAPLVADALQSAGLEGPVADGLTALASTVTGAAAGGTAGAAAAMNEVMNNYLSHPEAKRLQELTRLLDAPEELTDAQREAVIEELIGLNQLKRSREEDLNNACGQGGNEELCHFERAQLEEVFASWQETSLGADDRDTVFGEYRHTATLYGEHHQARMETIGAQALTEMVVDTATAPLIVGQIAGKALLGDAESRAIMHEMGQEIKAFASNPVHYIQESTREQLAQADALESAGHLEEADRLRVRVALENQSLLAGVGGLAASLPRAASRVVSQGSSRPGGVGPNGGSATPGGQGGVTNTNLPSQRPTWRQSEIDVTVPLEQQGFRTQVSFKDGVEVPYGTKGSTRPEAYKEGLSVEVKNYNVETSQGRNNLVSNVSNQVQHRAQNLPANTAQQVNIDVRGQNVSPAQLNQMIERIVERSNGALRAEDINILW